MRDEAAEVSKDLGRIGVWTAAPGLQSASAAAKIAAEVEELGFGTLWYPEGVGTKEAMTQGAMLLGCTSRIVIAAGIASIYARDAMAMANGARALAEAYPDRFILGLGVSHASMVAMRSGTYRTPIATMRSYLQAMDNAPYDAPSPPRPLPRLVGALGPRMLELSAKETLGAHTYLASVEHTKKAREILGAGPVLAPEQAVIFSEDIERITELAHSYLARYLQLANYRRHFKRLGWSEGDLSGGGSEALRNALIASGSIERIVGRVKAHIEAGADHVCIQLLTEDRADACLDRLRILAPALLALYKPLTAEIVETTGCHDNDRS